MIEINQLKENLKKCQNDNGVIVHNGSGQDIKIYFYNQKFATISTLYSIDNTNVLIKNGHSGTMCAPQTVTPFNSGRFYIIALGINDNPAQTYDIQNAKYNHLIFLNTRAEIRLLKFNYLNSCIL